MALCNLLATRAVSGNVLPQAPAAQLTAAAWAQVLWLQTGQAVHDPFRSPRQHARLATHLAHWRTLQGSQGAVQAWQAGLAACTSDLQASDLQVRGLMKFWQ